MSGIVGISSNMRSGIVGEAPNNTPAFKATLSATSGAMSGWTKITCDTEAWDTDDAYASGTFTVPGGHGGKYVFYGSAYFNQTTVSRAMLSFYVGATRVYTTGVYDQAGSVHGYPTVNIYTVLPVDAGVAVEFYAYSATASMTVYGDSGLQNQPASFGGFKLNGV